MERAVVLSMGKTIDVSHLPGEIINTIKQTSATPPDIQQFDNLVLQDQVEELEKKLIKQALLKTADNKAKAAQLLQISERSLWYKVKKYF